MSTWGPNLWHEGLWETFFIQALAPSCGLLNVYRVPQILKIDNKIWGALDSRSDVLLQVTPTIHQHMACFPGCWAVNEVQGHFPRHCCVSSSHLKKMIITVFFFFSPKWRNQVSVGFWKTARNAHFECAVCAWVVYTDIKDWERNYGNCQNYKEEP